MLHHTKTYGPYKEKKLLKEGEHVSRSEQPRMGLQSSSVTPAGGRLKSEAWGKHSFISHLGPTPYKASVAFQCKFDMP